ncbi:hypothetical protein ABFS83_04G148900 [Erythranthe nasuta]
MAYGAVISLTQTIERLLKSSRIPIVIKPSPRIIKHLYEEIRSLQEVLEELDSSINIDRERVNVLDGQIRDALWEFEDFLESHISNQFLSQSSPSERQPLTFSMRDVRRDIESFTTTVKKLKKAYVDELHNRLLEPPEEDGIDAVKSTIDLGVNKVAFFDLLEKVKHYLYSDKGIRTVALYGMAGIGKTTLAKKVYEDPLNTDYYFEFCVFVTVGPRYQLKEILKCILAQVDPDHDYYTKQMLMEGDDEVLSEYVYESLRDTSYFIVLDDVWDIQVWHDLEGSFPRDVDSESLFLLTTRLRGVAESCFRGYAIEMPFLDKGESWSLLEDKAFSQNEFCPPQIKDAGRKIAENCEGLPLLIVAVAQLLSGIDKTSECWNKVAEEKESMFMDANDQTVSKVLFPSYEYLPQHLKSLFLYMGVFPQNYEIRLSKIIKWWSGEGFPEPFQNKTSESSALEFLNELASRNVVKVHKRSTDDKGIKSYGLHSSFRYLSNKEAGKNKFFYNLNVCADGLAEGLKGQRRLCIRNNVLFAIKDVYNSIMSASTVCSLLCPGPHHPYPVPICLEYLRLLRVLDALTIRFYEFPKKVLNLVHLRYLAFTFNRQLPASISKLWNLRCLIILQNLTIIKADGNSSYMPIKIWNLQELEHLQIMGSNLPKPRNGSLLPNLLALVDVSAQSCTKDVFERIPNLQKLGIRIVLALDNVGQPYLLCLDHISQLRELKTLKCVVVNPGITSEVVSPHARLSKFPTSIVKLTLSGLGCPWKEIRKISSLPNLRVLKLRCYAFRGPKWKVGRDEFQALRFLLIEDADLVHLAFTDNDYAGFENLSCLSIKHCYKLKKIPVHFCFALEKIELVDCNPRAVACAKKARDNNWAHYYCGFAFAIDVQSSWDNEDVKSTIPF